jgi:Glyoxalase-like domain
MKPEKTVIDWPDPAYPQQMHLDIRVSDAGQAEQELLALGATRVHRERETSFRVFTDSAGHPFCIVSATTAQIEPVPASAAASA